MLSSLSSIKPSTATGASFTPSTVAVSDDLEVASYESLIVYSTVSTKLCPSASEINLSEVVSTVIEVVLLLKTFGSDEFCKFCMLRTPAS